MSKEYDAYLNNHRANVAKDGYGKEFACQNRNG